MSDGETRQLWRDEEPVSLGVLAPLLVRDAARAEIGIRHHGQTLPRHPPRPRARSHGHADLQAIITHATPISDQLRGILTRAEGAATGPWVVGTRNPLADLARSRLGV